MKQHVMTALAMTAQQRVHRGGSADVTSKISLSLFSLLLSVLLTIKHTRILSQKELFP